jgi:aryl-alcohol dehydrogenase-like predicted oxidoreductase
MKDQYKKPNVALYNLPFTCETFNGMPYRALGKSGLRVSSVGLGAWKIGYPETGDGSRVNEKSAFQLFDRSVELGVTFWDTANRYNNSSGNSERVIGNWLKNNPEQRRNIVLATKLAGTMDGLTPNHCGLSRTNILNSVYASLERLQTDYIDLLYFHVFDPSVPIEESLTAIEDLVKRDLIRYFAVSNFSIDQLNAYEQMGNKLSMRSRIVAVQNQFDILHGEPEAFAGVRQYASRKEISYIAWSPLARGLLTERYLDVKKVGPGDRLFDEGMIEKGVDQGTMHKVQALAALAREWDLKLSQLVLAYMLTLPGMGPVIPSSSSVPQVESNAAAGKVVLSDAQRQQVEKVLK